MMKKVAVIGHLDWTENHMIGAVVKARNILVQLEKQFGSDQVGNVDIYMWRNHKETVLKGILYAFAHYRNIVLVCSDTSVALMTMFKMLKKVFHNKILYCVVGGNMAELLDDNPKQIESLSNIDYFFAETHNCVEGMKKIGIDNVTILKNFKDIKTYKDFDFKQGTFCTFSRVTKEKGIEDAIKAIELLNRDGYMCRLDIYGEIDPEFSSEFERLLSSKRCKYCGVVNADEASRIIRQYYALIFPTRFDSEGMPGTIIDAFAASSLIICSHWKYCDEMICHRENGLVYPFKDGQKLVSVMKYAMDNPDEMAKYRQSAGMSYKNYSPEVSILPLLEHLQ